MAYIEDTNLIEEIRSLKVSLGGKNIFPDEAKESVLRVINEQPAADVVEVVRCKDCRHGKSLDRTKPPFKYYKDSCVLCECEDVIGDEPMVYFPSHFCSYGARKEINDV